MDWTEAEPRLATLERDVTRHQRLAREQRALARDVGRVAAVERGTWLGRWLGRRLPLLHLWSAPASAFRALHTVTSARLASGERSALA